MKYVLQIEVAVIGGDSRQIAVAQNLTNLVTKVKVYGHPQDQLDAPIVFCDTLPEALNGAQVIILPISGMSASGLVRGKTVDESIAFGDYFRALPEGTIVIVGSMTPNWKQLAANNRLIVYEYAEDNTIAILNSIPTAEGAVQIAMEQLPITIHGSKTLVIGFGRVGVTVARTFKALGSEVTVAARREELLARAAEMGCKTVKHSELGAVFGEVDLIINTVPQLVIDRQLLQLMTDEALIIDLASPPGGTDFEAAKELQRLAILAPGLPGKVAPKTAGAILASAIPEIMLKLLRDGGGL
ncbi:MAG TPA: dipicolinate synthase subunit DpsA [Bacillota bacterium]|nr:dipicolinate synthase subunit DpsA [Bacillota bacterium]HOL10501.1 dipicolinate synthase subunit DpsA [Bacillota bacterium]HPO98212.1 dipicolinate synthase subunit DpsA [Bacillota bacterium]